MMPLGSAPSPAGWPGDADDSPADGPVACEVANQMVGLLRKHAGRGPTKSKCAITEDLVVVTLEDCLTTLETQLAAAGNIELVRRVRRAIHQEMESEAAAIVEELTQKDVVAYLPAQDHDPDMAILVFHLARPEPLTGWFPRDPSPAFLESADSAPVQTVQEAETAPPESRSDARGLPAASARRTGEPRSDAARTRSRRPGISSISGGLGWLGAVVVSAVAALVLLLLSVGLLD